jgi:hypothetical protein
MRVTFSSFYDVIAQTHEAIDPDLVMSSLNNAIRAVNQSGLPMVAEEDVIIASKTSDVNEILIAPAVIGDLATPTYLGNTLIDIIGINNPSGVGMVEKSMDYLDRYASETEAVYWTRNNMIKLPLISETATNVGVDSEMFPDGSIMWFTKPNPDVFLWLDDILPLRCNLAMTIEDSPDITSVYNFNITITAIDRNSEDEVTLIYFDADLATVPAGYTVTAFTLYPLYNFNYYTKIANLTVSTATPAVQNTIYVPTRVFDIIINKAYSIIYASDKYYNADKMVYYETLYNNAIGVRNAK